MSLSLSVVHRPDKALADLEGIAIRAHDIRPAWRAIQADFLVIERAQFDTAGHGQWPALSPAYAAAKALRWPGKPPMQRTDVLRDSLTVGPQVAVVEPHGFAFGSTVPYGKFHQSRRPRSRLPRRALIDIQPSSHAHWRALVAAYVRHGQS